MPTKRIDDERPRESALQWWGRLATFTVAGSVAGCVVSDATIRACADACARTGSAMIAASQDRCACAPAGPAKDGGAP